MSLTRLFTITTIVLFALVEVMFARILWDEGRAYRTSAAGLGAIDATRLALVVAEKASFERGPTNGVLGGAPADPVKRAKLTAARAVTDGAIRDLQAAVALAVDLPHRGQASVATRQVQALLAAARADVDRTAAIPKSRRSADRVMGAVHEMFDVIPVAMQAATALSRDAEDVYPQFSDALVAARLAADLREYAGRLGSQFTAALTQQKPLAQRELFQIAAMRGRLDELRQLIALRTQTADTDPRVVVAEEQMERSYFGGGASFIAGVEAASAAHRPYGLDTAQFAARYQPTMASIVHLRDVLIAAAADGARANLAESRRNLVLIALMGGITALAVLAIFLLIRWRVVRPLLETTRVIVDIAQGKLHTEVPHADRSDEIGDMLKAVLTLKTNSIEKQRLERELQVLVDELRSMSTTDFLTGILNRRAFVEAATVQLAGVQRYHWPFALIMFDLDHFKEVNDRFGHEAGDEVLVRIAAIAKRELREGDVLARYGGEEYVVFASHCEPPKADVVSERMRAAIEHAAIAIGGERTVRMTASFGCVTGVGGKAYALENLLQSADRALYAAKDGGRNRVVTEIAIGAPTNAGPANG